MPLLQFSEKADEVTEADILAKRDELDESPIELAVGTEILPMFVDLLNDRRLEDVTSNSGTAVVTWRFANGEKRNLPVAVLTAARQAMIDLRDERSRYLADRADQFIALLPNVTGYDIEDDNW